METLADRIHNAFAAAAKENRACFVAYVCAGDPDSATSLEVCRTLIEEGTDILELGVPFSDPLADGLTNQLAAERALAAGMNQDMVFQQVEAIRAFSEVPIVFYTYYNLIFARGIEAYVERAAAAGVDGLLTLDLPPEEASQLEAACERFGIKTVFIAAPPTPPERLRLIAGHTTGFIYYVSREGVTGEQTSMAADLEEKVAAIRSATKLPVVVGFGISTPEHVRKVANVADGAVVGSALVNCIAHQPQQPTTILAELRAKMRNLTSELARG